MAVNLRILSLLGTAGVGAGISTPLTLNYLNRDDVQDIFLVSDGDEESMGLSRSRRSTMKAASESMFVKKIAKNVSEVQDLFEVWKKAFRRKLDKGSGKLVDVIHEEFNNHFETWKSEKDQISKSILDIKEELWNTLDLQDSLFRKQDKQFSDQFEELETSIKDIRYTQNNVMNWQNEWVEKKLSPKIQKLKKLLEQMQPNGVLGSV